MKKPQEIAILDYTYTLPLDRIALFPLPQRDASKLLIYRKGVISESVFKNLSAELPAKSLLVYNDSKVVAARLLFEKPSGGIIEIFCLSPHSSNTDVASALQSCGEVKWQCLVGGASKWKDGQILKKIINVDEQTNFSLYAAITEKQSGAFVIHFSWEPAHYCFADVLELVGAVPLPPYIKRQPEETDTERYQTVYAALNGSVAAPTAGLHFTDSIFKELETKNIAHDFVTLHVGAGTFKPVKSATMQEHDMHAEWIDVSRKNIEMLLKHGSHPIIAVGTTSLRTLESLYWIGVKILAQHSTGSTGDSREINFEDIDATMQPLFLSQWECYELAAKNISVKNSLETILQWLDHIKKERLIMQTQIIIAPGYTFKIVDGLITNFHQPQSTLLLLVAALIGDDWKNVYAYALENNFRLLSYGDGSLLWNKESRFS